MLLIKEDYKASLNKLKENGILVVPFILGSDSVLLDFGLDGKFEFDRVLNGVQQFDCKVLSGIEVTSKKKSKKTKLWDYRYITEDVNLVKLESYRVIDRELPVYRVDLTYVH